MGAISCYMEKTRNILYVGTSSCTLLQFTLDLIQDCRDWKAHSDFMSLTMLQNVIRGDVRKVAPVEGRTWSRLWVYSSIIFIMQHLYHLKSRSRLRSWTQTCQHPTHEAWESTFLIPSSSIMNPLAQLQPSGESGRSEISGKKISSGWRGVKISDPCLAFKWSQVSVRVEKVDTFMFSNNR